MAKIHIHIAMILIIFAMQYGQEVTPDEMSFKAGYYEGYTQWKLKKYMNSTD